MDGAASVKSEHRKFVAQRWQEYEVEQRANLLQTIATGSFYLIHRLHYHQVKLGFLQLENATDVDQIKDLPGEPYKRRPRSLSRTPRHCRSNSSSPVPSQAQRPAG